MDYPITKDNHGGEGITIVITYATGAVGIMFFYTRRFDRNGDVVWERKPTAEEIDKEIVKAFDTDANRDRLPVQQWRVLPGPEKKEYVGAWVDTGKGGISHDMGKAREIHRGLLRRERAIAFVELDTAYLRADEIGDKLEKQRIVAEKQRLRDITDHPSIEAAKTIEDLKSIKVV